MKKEQGPQDSGAAPVMPCTSEDDGPFERERGDQIDPPDSGSGGGNTTQSDI